MIGKPFSHLIRICRYLQLINISPLRQNIIQYKYKNEIKTSKNNKKKKKPTVPERRTDKTREYKYKYTQEIF